jgi:hypothetical protein
LRTQVHVPVGGVPDSVLRDGERVAGGQLADGPEHGARGRDEGVREEIVDPLGVQRPRHARVGQDRLDLGGEQEARAVLEVVERLDPDPIPHKPEGARAAVPEGEREHPAERVDAVPALLAVERQDDLGVTLRVKAVPLPDQGGPQLAEIVDLAVQDDGEPTVVAHDRLLPRREIDDGEPAVGEPDGTVPERPLSVGPAVGEAAAHAAEQRFRFFAAGRPGEIARDAAHRRAQAPGAGQKSGGKATRPSPPKSPVGCLDSPGRTRLERAR